MDDNEAIARYIMGWEKRERMSLVSGTYLPCQYWFDGSEYQVRDDLWRPDANTSQAMMVCEAMRGKKWEVRIAMLPDVPMWQDWRKYECSCELGSSQFNGAASNLETAITAAAWQVARAMEAQNAE